MSVIVRGMNMPKYCKECSNHFWFAGRIWCYYLDDSIDEGGNIDVSPPHNCPMTELPEKHGRLIDADAFVEYLENEFKSGYENDQKSDSDMKMLIAKMHELIITEINQRPTVVESEE